MGFSQAMTDDEFAVTRDRMMFSVPAASDCAGPEPAWMAVSFSILDIDADGLTVRLVDERDQRLDLRLNAAVADALCQCLGSAQDFALDQGRFRPLSGKDGDEGL